MHYSIDIDVRELDLHTDDLIELAEENGDILYTEDGVKVQIEEAIAEFKEENVCYTQSELDELIAQAYANGEASNEDNTSELTIIVERELRNAALRISAMIRGDYDA